MTHLVGIVTVATSDCLYSVPNIICFVCSLLGLGTQIEADVYEALQQALNSKYMSIVFNKHANEIVLQTSR